ncbi:hypothetical protein JXL19_11950 [bacterium]|nr:hypothetical protein [bacterium]
MTDIFKSRNHVFGNLWNNARNGGFDRQVDRARNNKGRRALKFETEGLHRVMILEADHRPGFEVCICGLTEKPGLINANGIITFAGSVETERLETLFKQIDHWIISFETIFGKGGMGISCNNGQEGPTVEATDIVIEGVSDTHSVPVYRNECQALDNQVSYRDWDRIDRRQGNE